MSNLNQIIDDIELYVANDTIPTKEKVEAFCFLFKLPQFHPVMVDDTIRDLIGVIESELINSEIKDSMIDTYFYALGVRLFDLSIQKQISSENINSSMDLFDWAVSLNTNYYQAYNRLGTCHMFTTDGQKTALSCFKASLKYLGTGKNNLGIFKFAGGYTDNFKGDNYLKMGLCFLKLNKKNNALLLLKEARKHFNNEYSGFTDFGFSSFDQVLEYANNYNYEDDSKDQTKKEQEKELILEKITQAVSLKRNGDFDKANSIYTGLDSKFPNDPIIHKSWAKILVCLGEYDNAIEKYKNASVLYKSIGNPEYYQCDDQMQKIVNRFENPEKFTSWVYAVSGGSIQRENVVI